MSCNIERSFVFFTGIDGMRIFNHQVDKAFTTELLKELNKLKKVTPEENTSLEKMIDSADTENFDLAKIIINTKICQK